MRLKLLKLLFNYYYKISVYIAKKISYLERFERSYDYKHIAIIKDKSLFKGNKCNIRTYQHDHFNKGFVISNAYYNNFYSQEYNMLTDTTQHQITICVNRAKWVADKIDIIDLISNSGGYIEYIDARINIHPDIQIVVRWSTYAFTEFVISFDTKGLSFLNHWDQINKIKEVKRHTKHIYKVFKDADASELALFANRKNDTTLEINLEKLLNN